MRHFLIDIGNSRIKWGYCLAGQFELLEVGSCYYINKTLEDLTSILNEQWLDEPPPAAIMLASVGNKEVTHQVETWLTTHWQQPQQLQTTAQLCGVRNAYSDPARLGTDRWAALIAAHAIAEGAVFIADCGTAITLDVLSDSGEHQGGFILPGLAMMRQALKKDTQGLPLASNYDVAAIKFADNTGDAIIGGTVLAAAASIDKAIIMTEKRFGKSLCSIITGGDALLLKPILACSLIYEPHLVLKGLALVLNHNEVLKT